LAEKISTRAVARPELDRAVALAREIRASGAAVTIVVHEHKRLGRGIELAALAEQLRAGGIGLEFLTGEPQGSHDPSGVIFTVLAARTPGPADQALLVAERHAPEEIRRASVRALITTMAQGPGARPQGLRQLAARAGVPA
jgi:hypothetical protein